MSNFMMVRVRVDYVIAHKIIGLVALYACSASFC